MSERGRERALVSLLVAVNAIVHAWLSIPGLGEPDQARLTVLAGLWHHTGTLSFGSYLPRTSPLCLHALKAALDLGVPLSALPAMMNGSNVLFGASTLLLLYFLFRPLVGARAGLYGLLAYALTPAFFVAQLYGMPHLPAFAAWLAALLTFRGYRDRPGGSGFVWLAVAIGWAALAACLKADVVLFGLGFLALLLGPDAGARPTRAQVAAALAVPALAVLSVTAYSRALAPPQAQALTKAAADWSVSFPFSLAAITHFDNASITPLSAGPISFLLMLVALLAVPLFRLRPRSLGLALLLGLPQLLFWGLIEGNSARHLMGAYAGLCLLLAEVAEARLGRWAGPALAAALVVQLGVFPASGSTRRPSPRLWASRDRLAEGTERLHAAARALASDARPRQVAIGSHTLPYFAFEQLASAVTVQIAPGGFVRVDAAGRTVRFEMVQTSGPPPPIQAEAETAYGFVEDGISLQPGP